VIRRPTLAWGARLALGFVLVIAVPAGARADASRSGEAPLTPLPAETVRSLAPWLAVGGLILMESEPKGRLRQVGLFSIVNAPAATVFEVLAHPEHFIKMIPSMVRSEVVRREGKTLDVAWELEIPFQNPAGVNRYLDERPAAIRYYPISGTVPYAAWRWECYPRGPGRTIVAHYTTADVRQVSWIVRRFLAAWPTFEHGAVASTAIVFVKAVAEFAEARHAGREPRRPRYQPGVRRAVRSLVSGERKMDPSSLAPLLKRGLVALVEFDDKVQLQQASILANVAAPPEQLMQVLTGVESLPEFVPTTAKVVVRRRAPGLIEYQHWMTMPLIELEMHMQMRHSANRVALRALPSGDLSTQSSGWEVLPGGAPDTGVLLYYLSYDPGEIAWFVKKLLQREPHFVPGLALATGLVTVRAIADRASGQPATR